MRPFGSSCRFRKATKGLVLMLTLLLVGCRPPSSQSERVTPLVTNDGGVSDAPQGGTQTVMDAPEGGFSMQASTEPMRTLPNRKRDRFVICHRDEDGREKTLTVGAAAVDGHLSHGDALEQCAPPRLDATAVLLQMREGATGVAVIDVVSISSRTISALPGVVMDVTIQPLNTLLGTVPIVVVRRGGTLPDGTIVHAAEEPPIRRDRRYLAFFYETNSGTRIGETLPTDGASVSLRGEQLTITQVQAILQQ